MQHGVIININCSVFQILLPNFDEGEGRNSFWALCPT